MQSLGPNGLQVQSCRTPDRSGGGPGATAITVGTDSGASVLVGGGTYFALDDEDEDVGSDGGDDGDDGDCVGNEANSVNEEGESGLDELNDEDGDEANG